MAYRDFKNPDRRNGSCEKLFVYISAIGNPVGVCGLYAPPGFPKGTISLHWTAVQPLFQFAGIGSCLLNHVERVAVSLGFTNLVVECDGMLNRYAHNFYRKKGFKLSEKKMWTEWQEWPKQCDVLEKSLTTKKTDVVVLTTDVSSMNRADAINVLKEWLIKSSGEEEWMKHIR